MSSHGAESELFAHLTDIVSDPYIERLRDCIAEVERELNCRESTPSAEELQRIAHALNEEWIYAQSPVTISGDVERILSDGSREPTTAYAARARSQGFLIQLRPVMLDDEVIAESYQVRHAFSVSDPALHAMIDYFDAPLHDLEIGYPFPSDELRRNRFEYYHAGESEMVLSKIGADMSVQEKITRLAHLRFEDDKSQFGDIEAGKDYEAFLHAVLELDEEVPYRIALNGELGVYTEYGDVEQEIASPADAPHIVKVEQIRLWQPDIMERDGGRGHELVPFLEGTRFGAVQGMISERVLIPFTSVHGIQSLRA